MMYCVATSSLCCSTTHPPYWSWKRPCRILAAEYADVPCARRSLVTPNDPRQEVFEREEANHNHYETDRRFHAHVCHIRTTQDKADEHDAIGKGDRKSGSASKHPSASPLDPPGVVFEPPANQRGAAPYRRIINRQAWAGRDCRLEKHVRVSSVGVQKTCCSVSLSE